MYFLEYVLSKGLLPCVCVVCVVCVCGGGGGVQILSFKSIPILQVIHLAFLKKRVNLTLGSVKKGYGKL